MPGILPRLKAGKIKKALEKDWIGFKERPLKHRKAKHRIMERRNRDGSITEVNIPRGDEEYMNPRTLQFNLENAGVRIDDFLRAVFGKKWKRKWQQWKPRKENPFFIEDIDFDEVRY